MTIKVLFWNVWLENQLRGIKKSKDLLNELDKLISEYKPDCIGLNEVLKHTQDQIPIINEFLEKNGYKYHYFSHGSPFTDKWDIGSAICSRFPINNLQEIELGKNVTAEKKGHKHFPIKAIAAKIEINSKKEIGIIVAHPINLKPSSIIDHFTHTKNLSNFIKNSDYHKNTIIGGDFNEPMYFPMSFKNRTKKYLNHRTGTKINPTWRHNSWRITPLRANLDRLFWTKNGFLKLKKFNVLNVRVSDHKPIYAEFYVNNQV
jgi:endonuclease/exonuclease/phosphatase family metal-dependent hydrolase